jgi:hypothetical protein
LELKEWFTPKLDPQTVRLARRVHSRERSRSRSESQNEQTSAFEAQEFLTNIKLNLGDNKINSPTNSKIKRSASVSPSGFASSSVYDRLAARGREFAEKNVKKIQPSLPVEVLLFLYLI